MGGPAWLSDLLALITLVVSGYCLGRLVVSRTRRRPTDVDVDLVHGAMGVGMAAMLVPGISPLPEVTWAWAFGVAAAWLAWRIVSAGNIRIARAHYLPHLVMAVGMIYMGAAASIPARGAGAGSGTAMGGPGTAAHFPLGALILALFMFGYAVWVLDQLPAIATVRALRAAPPLVLAASAVLVPVAAVGGSSPGSAVLDRPVPLSPRLEAGCHIAMAVVMGYLLILMV